MHRFGDELVNPRLQVLDDENKQLIAKVAELLDKLIGAESFINELSEKLEKQKRDAREMRKSWDCDK
jgi:predicted  nucleic acid-binding Zn-ribbon protein